MVTINDLEELEAKIRELKTIIGKIKTAEYSGWKFTVINPLTEEEIEMEIPVEKREELINLMNQKLTEFDTKIKSLDLSKIE